ncbi:LysM peptidoglycan-binding domain-containing protein [Chromobacterium vaccinii]|uniref:LysM peptidoglycan-binding domain-containing protein n=1 Tax=Chromobacterium vaccinii TaxID=1108595 RepID=UPI001E3A6737|nr:LysM peptidoglycan-binding domain-containing protein [Chromobacterium vaccinii]MCD4498302.1 LysM peptidoglycan-binding domain-containing protein [Chromobacterium vaccinii]
MVAVIAGAGLGLQNGSSAALGGRGQLGTPEQGRGGEQVIVNASNGNLILQHRDEYLAAAGLPVGFLRTYNSQGGGDGAGNWRLGYSRQIAGLSGVAGSAGSTVHRIAEDGSDTLYAYDAARGSYVSQYSSSADDTLRWDGQGWTWIDGQSQASERYDAQGRLQQVLSADGAGIALAYNGAGRIVSLQDASGESMFVDYDAAGNFTQVRTVVQNGGQTQTLTRVRYGYDSANRLVSVTTDLSPEDNSVADGRTYTVRYAYDGTSTRISSLQQDDGSRLDFSYALTGGAYRIQTVVDVGADGASRATRFDYDDAKRRTSVTDAARLTSSLDYDGLGQLKQVSAGGISQSFNYDSHGRVSDVIDGRGQKTHFEYDAAGNRVLSRDAMGHAVARRYNAQNQLLSETVDGAGTARNVYDASGRHLRFAISAEGRVLERRYDAQGRETARIAYQGGVVPGNAATEADLQAWAAKQDMSLIERNDTAYDPRGLVASTTRYLAVDAQGNGVADGKQIIVHYAYDQAGNLLQKIDGDGNLTSYRYDGLNRVVASTDALGNVAATVYSDAARQNSVTLSNGLTTITSYDQSGQAISVARQDAGGPLGATRYQYGAAGRLLRATDPVGRTSTFLYDDLGRKSGELDVRGALTEYVYNGNDQTVRTIRYATLVDMAKLSADPELWRLDVLRPAADPANDRQEISLYDADGRLARSIDALGYVTAMRYDAAGRLTDTIRYANALSAAQLAKLLTGGKEPAADDPSAVPAIDAANDRVSRRFYDQDGLLLGSLDGEGYLTEIGYDGAGHAVRSTRYATQSDSRQWASGVLAALRPAANANDQQIVTLYDEAGRVAGVIDAEGYLTETRYDAAGNATQSIRYATKANAARTLIGARPQASAQDRTTLSTYDALNRLARQESQPDGLVVTYRYDSEGRLLESVRDGGGDSRGQLKRYDSQGRLTAELSGEGAQALAALGGSVDQARVDAVWARWGARHRYDAAGRVIETAEPDGMGGANRTLFYYDEAGRLAYRIDPAGAVTEYRYNAFGEQTQVIRYASALTSAALPGLQGGQAGALGDQVARLAAAGQDSATSAGYSRRGEIVADTDALGNVNTRSYNGFGEVVARSDRLDAARTQDTRYQYDRRGLSTQRSDGTGAKVLSRSVFDAFGRPVQQFDAMGNMLTRQYDRLGREVVTVDPANVRRSTAYDALDRVLSVTDGFGNVTRSSYDDAAGSLTLTTPEGVQTVTTRNRFGDVVQVKDGRGNVTRYRYDRDGKLLETARPDGSLSASRYDDAGRVQETVDARGIRTAYSYDAAGRVLTRTLDPAGLSLTTRYQYDALGRTMRLTDPSGSVTQTQYDAKGQATRVIVDAGGLSLTTIYSYDAAGHVLNVTRAAGSAAAQTSRYDYDNQGRRVTETVDPDGLKLVTRYEYDANGNMVKRTDPAGNATLTVYDGDNRPVFQIDGAGSAVRTEYDAAGRAFRTTAFATPVAMIGMPAVPRPTDIQNRLGYNPADQVLTTYYDKDGRARYRVDGQGYATQYSYDAAGNVTQTTRYANLASLPPTAGAMPMVSASAGDQTEAAVYDAANRAVCTVDAEGYVTRHVYDTVGNQTRFIRFAKPLAAGADPAAIAGDPASDQMGSTVYDAAGRPIFTIDAEGYVTGTSYDAAGHPLQTIRYANRLAAQPEPGAMPAVADSPLDVKAVNRYDSAGRLVDSVDAEGNVVHSEYDAAGLLSAQTRGYGSAAASRTRYDYDTAGRRVAETRGDGTPLAATIRYQLDGAGNRVVETDPAGHATRRTFDGAGHRLSETDALGNVIRSEYDAFGNVVRLTDARGNSGVFYFDRNNKQVLQVDPLGYATATVYNAFGKATRITRYSRMLNGSGKPSQMPALQADPTRDKVTVAEYDRRNLQLKAASGDGIAESYGYDAFGNRIRYVNKAGGQFTYEYDRTGRLISETSPVQARNAAGQMAPVVKRYEYDARGNRTRQVEAAGLPEQRITVYQYDALDRLVAQIGDSVPVFVDGVAGSASPTQRRQYDAAGNLIVAIDAGGNATRTWFDAQGRKCAERNPAGTLTLWDYDAAGNMVRQRVYADPVAISADGAQPAPVDAARVRETRYGYDADNRLIETRIPNQWVGVRNATTGNYELSRGDLVTRKLYDANGNVVQETDARGNSIYRYFDAAGRKTLEVDAENYAISWDYDSNGNVQVETRYANRLQTPTSAGSTWGSVYAALKRDQANDRQRVFTYDVMGRVTDEVQVNVLVAAVNGNGSVREASNSAATHYAYNALGKVVQKIDANGGISNWTYDALGRELEHQDVAFADYRGVQVRPTTDSEYNGLDQVVRLIRKGDGVAADQVTSSSYGIGGRLLSQTDPSGVAIEYQYDLTGNVTATRRARLNADGQRTDDETRYRYDATGRQIDKFDVASGMHFETRYNAYGQIDGKRTSADLSGPWQEFSEYDGAGRAIKTNSGNGATKVYFYDANGNATLSLESASVDLRALSQDQLQGMLSDASLSPTINEYDKRNQSIGTYQPKMANARDQVSVRRWQDISPVGGGVVSVGSDSQGANPGGPIASGDVVPSHGGRGTMDFSFGQGTVNRWVSNGNQVTDTTIHGLDFIVRAPAAMELGNGKYKVSIKVDKVATTQANYAPNNEALSQHFQLDRVFEQWDGNGFRIHLPDDMLTNRITLESPLFAFTSKLNISVVVTKQVGLLDIPVASYPMKDVIFNATGVQSVHTCDMIHFEGQPNNTNRMVMMTRPAGANVGWTFQDVPSLFWAYAVPNSPAQIANLASTPGWFAFDYSKMTQGRYEMRYLALDSKNNVVNSQQGILTLGSGGSSFQAGKLDAGSGGQALMASSGYLEILGQGGDATQATIAFRSPGGAWSAPKQLGINNMLGQSSGWFEVMPYYASLAQGQPYEYLLESKDKNGNSMRKVTGRFTVGDANSVTQPVDYSALPQNVHVQKLLSGAVSGVMRFRPAGSTGAFTEAPMVGSPGELYWDGSAQAPATGSQDYEFQFVLRDSAGQMVDGGQGVFRLGADRRVLSFTKNQMVTFSAVPANSAKLVLQYRPAGSAGGYQQATVQKGSDGSFHFDATALTQGGGVQQYEYFYNLQDDRGVVLKTPAENPITVSGILSLGADVPDGQLKWVITGIADSSRTIHRQQSYNAFGEVVQEVDGRGNATDFSYSVQGKLLNKLDAATSATAENGYQYGVRANTHYYYDAMGNQVGVQDGNFATNTQQILAGSVGNNAKTSVEFHVDSGRKRTGYDVFGNARYVVDEVGRRTDYSYDAMNRLVRIDRPQRVDGARGWDAYEYDSAGQRVAHSATDGKTIWRDRTYYDSLGRVISVVSAAGRNTRTSYAWDAGILGAGGAVVGGWRTTVTDANGRSQIDDADLYGHKVRHVDLGNHTFHYRYSYTGQITAQNSGDTGQDIVYEYYGNGYLKSISDRALDSYSLYEYDADGNKTFEGYTTLSATHRTYYQYADITYDGRNRMTSIIDPKFQTTYEYDVVGNKRRVVAYYHDGANGQMSGQDNWYRYDAMNRFVVTMGVLVGERGKGTIKAVNNKGAAELTYNVAGERVTAAYFRDGHREQYSYTADGYLEDTTINGALAAHRVNDMLGRATGYVEYKSDGKTESLRNASTYDADGKLLDQVSGSKHITNSLMADGTVDHSTEVDGGTTVNTYYSYEWWDEAKQSTLTAQPYNKNAPGWKQGTSHYVYDVNGHLNEARDEEGKRGFHYVSNAQGLILLRDEVSASTGRAPLINKQHMYYYLDGKRVGDVGNDGSDNESNVDYAMVLALRSTASRKDQYRDWKPISSADFDQNYQPIGPNYPGTVPSRYTVRSGDTLRSIASELWGDGAMWYLLADANGLSGAEALKPGQQLTVPNKVTNIHNNSSTFRVYNPGEAMGDTSPTLPDAPPPPPPPASHGGGGRCGGLGMVLVIVVAVIAVVVTAGAMAVAMGASGTIFSAGAAVLSGTSTIGVAGTMLAAAVGGAAGSVAGQGAAMAMGMQDQFSWSQVGASALSSGLSAGVGTVVQSGAMAGALSNTFGSAAPYVQVAVNNAAMQGVAMVTGQQKSFSWSAIAASEMAAAFGRSGWGDDLRQNMQSMTDGMGVSKDLSQTLAGMPGNFLQSAAADFAGGERGRAAWGHAFLQSGARAVGDYGSQQSEDSWGEGGYKRMLAHMAVGAVGAEWQGRDALAAAAGAGVASMAAPWLDESLGMDDGARQRILPQLSRLAGAAAAQAFGGDVFAAGDAGQNATENNYLTHRQVDQVIAALKRASSAQERQQILARARELDKKQSWLKLVGDAEGLADAEAGAAKLREFGFSMGFGRGGSQTSRLADDLMAEIAQIKATPVMRDGNWREQAILERHRANAEVASPALMFATGGVGAVYRGASMLAAARQTGYGLAQAADGEWLEGGSNIVFGALGFEGARGIRGVANPWDDARVAGREVPSNIRFNSQADPLFDTLGHAKLTHPEEYQSIMADLQRNQVNVKYGEKAISFSPNSGGGNVGNEILLPEDFSISALRHEYGHFLDHQALGYPRYIEYFKSPELIVATERSQYLSEIRFARELGDTSARRTLTENYLRERNYIVDTYYQRPYGGKYNPNPFGRE